MISCASVLPVIKLAGRLIKVGSVAVIPPATGFDYQLTPPK